MDKILTFQTQTEKGVFLYTIGEGRDHEYLTKTANQGFHPEIQGYIDNAKPIQGKTQLLLTALGAGEFWGSNVNGDFFPATSLAHDFLVYNSVCASILPLPALSLRKKYSFPLISSELCSSINLRCSFIIILLVLKVDF